MSERLTAEREAELRALAEAWGDLHGAATLLREIDALRAEVAEAEERGAGWMREAAARECDDYALAVTEEDDADICQEAYAQGEISGARDCAGEVRALSAAEVCREARARR